MNDLLDGECKEQVARDCESHLRTCPRCACLVRTVRKAIQLYRGCDPPPIPQDIRARIWRAFFMARHRN
jgi:anti-sigma factor RsiW